MVRPQLLPSSKSILVQHPSEFDSNCIDNECIPIRRHLPPPKAEQVSCLSLPRKSQLFILFLCRVFDFLQAASLQPYLFYQLKSFDSLLSDAQISRRAGIIQGSFTCAQAGTAILWGKASDSSWGGRKTLLLVGLLGTAISCLGYGFATTFIQAAAWRAFGGAVNGTVGIIRTQIAEITKEKKYQSRAFLILPLSFNVASILGPVLGGLLADPASTLPQLFGPNAVLKMQWLQIYPYALPGVLNFIFLTATAAFVFFGLEETLKTHNRKFDMGIYLWDKFCILFKPKSTSGKYSTLNSTEHMELETQIPPRVFNENTHHTKKFPFYRIFTKNVIFTLITTAFFDFHLGAFTSLWSLLLSTPRAAPDSQVSLPFIFTGGLGMPVATVGLAMSILGILGMALQFLLYPTVHARMGTLSSFRAFLVLFPIAYFLAPYLAAVPPSTPAPYPSAGAFIWIGITLVLLLHVTARTFALPATIILLNNSSPHPTVLGTVHGIGQSVSAAFRTIGPMVGGLWYGEGLERGVVGLAWWATAGVAGAGCVTALCVYEGSGHEIYLEGEKVEEGV